LCVTEAPQGCLDSIGLARSFDLDEVALQKVQLRLQPPGVRQYGGPIFVGQGRPGVVEHDRFAKAGAPGLQGEPAFPPRGTYAIGSRKDLDEPLAAVGDDPDAELVTGVDIEPLLQASGAAAVQQAIAAVAQPLPRHNEQLPVLIEPPHWPTLSC
jgi:hypothetical protein